MHFARQTRTPSKKMKIMIHQLRIYEIFETNKQAFHARFRDHAARIMKTYGFQIAAMWEARSGEKTQFIYLLEWSQPSWPMPNGPRSSA
jgi:hypothetical protein